VGICFKKEVRGNSPFRALVIINSNFFLYCLAVRQIISNFANQFMKAGRGRAYRLCPQRQAKAAAGENDPTGKELMTVLTKF